MFNIVILNINGEINESKANINKTNITNYCKKNLINKGENDPIILGKWEDDLGYIIMYGWEIGKEQFINSNELPPPIDDINCYGDILIIREDCSNNLLDFSKENYLNFYNLQNIGMDNNSLKDNLSEDEYISSEDELFSENDENSFTDISENLENEISSDELQMESYDTDEYD